MKSCKKAKALNFYGEWTGVIGTDEEYNEVRDGKKDWRPIMKERMEFVRIPYETFQRLLRLDRQVTAIPFTCTITPNLEPKEEAQDDGTV